MNIEYIKRKILSNIFAVNISAIENIQLWVSKNEKVQLKFSSDKWKKKVPTQWASTISPTSWAQVSIDQSSWTIASVWQALLAHSIPFREIPDYSVGSNLDPVWAPWSWGPQGQRYEKRGSGTGIKFPQLPEVMKIISTFIYYLHVTGFSTIADKTKWTISHPYWLSYIDLPKVTNLDQENKYTQCKSKL